MYVFEADPTPVYGLDHSRLSRASVPRVSWASRHQHVQGRLTTWPCPSCPRPPCPLPCCPCPCPSCHELAGATAHLAQHVEPRLPAEDVVGVVFEDRPRLAGDRPTAPALGFHGQWPPLPVAVLLMQKPLSVGCLRPVPEDVVLAPLLQLAVDDQVVVAAAAPRDHAGAARLNPTQAGIFGRRGTGRGQWPPLSVAVLLLQEPRRACWPSPGRCSTGSSSAAGRRCSCGGRGSP